MAPLRLLVQDAVCRADGQRVSERHGANPLHLLTQLLQRHVFDMACRAVVPSLTRRVEHVAVGGLEQRKLETSLASHRLHRRHAHRATVCVRGDILLADSKLKTVNCQLLTVNCQLI